MSEFFRLTYSRCYKLLDALIRRMPTSTPHAEIVATAVIYTFCLLPQVIISVCVTALHAPTELTVVTLVGQDYRYYRDCTWNMFYYPLPLLIMPLVYMVVSFPLLFTGLRVAHEYEVMLMRYSIGGWFAFLMTSRSWEATLRI